MQAEPIAPPPSPPRFGTRRWLAVIGVIVVFAALYAARGLFVPIVFSILTSFILSPAVRALVHARIPRALAALVVVLVVLCIAAGLVAALAGPAQEWIERAPVAVERIEGRIKELRRPLKAASDATQRVISLGAEPAKDAPQIVSETPNVVLSVLKEAPALLTSVVASVFLIFLVLLHGDELMRKLITFVPKLSGKKEFVLGTREVQVELSRYLLTVSVINMGLGLATALALFLLGVSDPLLWAGVVALMNFAPYVGPAITSFVLLVVGFAEFSTVTEALAVPGAFLLLHAIEGQLITPLLLGRRLALDPVLIFIGLIVFGWMWGFAGLLMAVPMLACIRIVAQHVPGGEPWARLMSSESRNGRGAEAEPATEPVAAETALARSPPAPEQQPAGEHRNPE